MRKLFYCSVTPLILCTARTPLRKNNKNNVLKVDNNNKKKNPEHNEKKNTKEKYMYKKDI